MSDGWVGGLPPAAAARMQRMQADGVKTSFLSVAGAVAAGSVGMHPLGEVMGCVVAHLGWRGWGGCGWYPGSMSNASIPLMQTAGSNSAFSSFTPYADAMRAGYWRALERLRAEATALGADGVIGVRLTVGHLGSVGDVAMSESTAGSAREFLAVGSAVRVDGNVRPRVPFITDLDGADTAKLMLSGWVPSGFAFGLAVAIRHDDYRTVRQASSWLGGNNEIEGYTALVQHVRETARADFRQRAMTVEADGALMSASALHVWEIEPSEGHTDHVAEAFVSGSTVARFRRTTESGPTALSIMSLRDSASSGATR